MFCDSNVSARGSCGHLTRWLCVEEDDPRLRSDYTCLNCLRDRWLARLGEARVIRNVAENEESSTDQVTQVNDALGLNAETMLEKLRERASGLLPPSAIVSTENIEELSLKALILSYCDILECQVDILSECLANDQGNVSFKEPPNLADAMGCYDTVYTVLEAEQRLEESLRMVDTQYGLGTRAKLLSFESLSAERSKHGVRKSFSICLADVPCARTVEGKDIRGMMRKTVCR